MRGAVWDASDGKRLSHVRGFRGAYFDSSRNMYAVFPPSDSYTSKGVRTKDEYKQLRSRESQREERDKIGAQEVRWTPGSTQFTPVSSVTKRFDSWQHGPYLIVSERTSAEGKPIDKRELEVRDVMTGSKLWTRKFSGSLASWYYNITGDSFAMVWDLKDDSAKEILKSDPSVRAKVDALSKRKGTVLLEVLDHRTGNRRFAFPVDTGEGSFRIRDVDVVGDTVMLADTEDRLVIMNSQGERKGRIFATRGVLDATGKILAAQIEPGRVALISVDGMQQKSVFTFGNRIAYMAFSSDSKRLIVITADQTFYTFSVG